jgi:hypothetical protein
MNAELERMWKEVVVSYFKVLCMELILGTEDGHEKLQNSRCPD